VLRGHDEAAVKVWAFGMERNVEAGIACDGMALVLE